MDRKRRARYEKTTNFGVVTLAALTSLMVFLKQHALSIIAILLIICRSQTLWTFKERSAVRKASKKKNSSALIRIIPQPGTLTKLIFQIWNNQGFKIKKERCACCVQPAEGFKWGFQLIKLRPLLRLDPAVQERAHLVQFFRGQVSIGPEVEREGGELHVDTAPTRASRKKKKRTQIHNELIITLCI